MMLGGEWQQISKTKCSGAGREEIMIKDNGKAVTEEDKCHLSVWLSRMKWDFPWGLQRNGLAASNLSKSAGKERMDGRDMLLLCLLGWGMMRFLCGTLKEKREQIKRWPTGVPGEMPGSTGLTLWHCSCAGKQHKDLSRWEAASIKGCPSLGDHGEEQWTGGRQDPPPDLARPPGTHGSRQTSCNSVPLHFWLVWYLTVLLARLGLLPAWLPGWGQAQFHPSHVSSGPPQEVWRVCGKLKVGFDTASYKEGKHLD